MYRIIIFTCFYLYALTRGKAGQIHHAHACVNACTHAHRNTCIHIASMHTCMCIYAHKQSYVWLHFCVLPIYPDTYTHVCRHSIFYLHLRAYTHMHMRTSHKQTYITYILHITCCMLRAKCCILPVTCYMPHAA